MRLTKYEHACLVLDNGKSKLVIDPGCFTKLPTDLSGTSCVIVTEEHIDHFNAENLRMIIAQNPEVKIYSTKTVCDSSDGSDMNITRIDGEQTVLEGGYSINFYETPHAAVYKKSPCRSLSVKIDNYLYYPSDSYNTINDEVDVLALPTSGPWHKLEEAIDFANTIKSKKILATHNGLYNDDGNNVANNFIKTNIADPNREYVYLTPNESLSDTHVAMETK